MAQHDQQIDNNTGAGFRTDVNGALAALFSTNSGATAPTVTVAGQFWYDTSNAPPKLKIRDAANAAWIVVTSLDSIDIGFGKRSTPAPPRFVWNTKADLSGTDIMILANDGKLSLGAQLTLMEADGSARAIISAGIASDPGTTTFTVHDAAGAIVGTMKQSATGLDLYSNGVLRFYDTGGINRGAIAANTGDATARVTINARDGTGAVINTFNFDAGGIRMTSGDFYIMEGTLTRGRFGFDTNGTLMAYNDSGGNYKTAFNLAANGLYLRGVIGTIGALRMLSPTNVQRGMLRFNTEDDQSGLASLYTYQTSGAVQQQIDFDNTGISIKQGASAGNVMTDGNFPSKSTSAGNVDFPIGSFIFFTCPAGNEVNRSQDLTLRLNTLDSFSYRHTGSGTLLAGRWINTGISTGAASGLGRRIS